MNTDISSLTRRPFPLPSDVGRPDVLRDYYRACAATVIAHVRNQGFDHVARQMFGARDGEALTRAAVPPASMTQAGWASTFATAAVGVFLKSLAPQSAAARLFTAAPLVPLDGVAQVSLPRNVSTFPEPAFAAEGEPMRIVSGNFTAATLGPPRKMAYAVGLTGELEQYSAEQATVVMETCMREASARTLDAAVFSAAAGDATRPPGLLNGVTTLPPGSGGGMAALINDMRNLVGGIVNAGGGANIAIVADPRELIALAIYAPAAITAVNLMFLPVPTLAAGTIVAVEVGAIASGFTGLPQIDLSKETTLHFEDTNPAHIGTPGTPNVVAAPTRSLWQTDTLALRAILRCAWCVRAPGMVQVVTGITW